MNVFRLDKSIFIKGLPVVQVMGWKNPSFYAKVVVNDTQLFLTRWQLADLIKRCG